MNIILGDYLSAILGTFRECSTWCLDPLREIRHAGETIVNRAEGNAVSAEFNLLYRWHATLSDNDEQWLQSALRDNLPADHPSQDDLDYEWTRRDYGIASATVLDQQGTDPRRWTFAGSVPVSLFFSFSRPCSPSDNRLKREPNGTFKSHELARHLQDATRTIACGFGPRGIPAVLRPIEIMGIEQARRWGVCTLNEFRQFMGLRKFDSFEQWCPVSDVAVRLRLPLSFWRCAQC